MNVGNRIVLLILASLVLCSVPKSHDELASNTDYYTQNESIIEIENGYHQIFNDNGNVNFTLQWLPTNASNISYTIIDSDVERYSGTIEINITTSMTYQIPIFHHIISPCICVLLIDIEQYNENRIIIEAGNNNENSEWMIVPSIELNKISTPIIDVKNSIIIPTGEQYVFIKSSIISESNYEDYCIGGIINEQAIDFNNLSSIETNHTHKTITNGQIEIEFDLRSFDDGWVSIIYQIGNELEWSNTIACIHVKLDLLSPVISIDSPTEIDERFGLLIIDGSSSFDPNWGRDELQYIWSYQDMENPYSTPVSVIGSDNGIFTFDASNSGNFRFNLTLIDGASHTSTQSITVKITNIRPQANIRIESVPVDDGEIIRLTNQQSWIVDAKYSTDTQNDIDNLTYTWFVDGNPVMSGRDRILSRPSDDNVMHELTLMVEDDDGAVDWVTVTIGIVGTPSDPNDTEISSKIIAGISVTVLIITIIAFFTISAKSSQTPNIRRWQSNKSDESTDSRTDD